MRFVLWPLFALIATSSVIAAPVSLPAAHATLEPLAGWMVMPAGAYVAMTKALAGYVAVRKLDRERAMVGLALGHVADEKNLVRTLASVRSKAFTMHPQAKAVARRLQGKRLSYLSSSSRVHVRERSLQLNLTHPRR